MVSCEGDTCCLRIPSRSELDLFRAEYHSAKGRGVEAIIHGQDVWHERKSRLGTTKERFRDLGLRVQGLGM